VAATIANTPNRWLRTSAQLARLYRKNGQGEKARAIEAQLSKLLAEADAGHPLVVELARSRVPVDPELGVARLPRLPCFGLNPAASSARVAPRRRGGSDAHALCVLSRRASHGWPVI
jgi:hypothetical protein